MAAGTLLRADDTGNLASIQDECDEELGLP